MKTLSETDGEFFRRKNSEEEIEQQGGERDQQSRTKQSGERAQEVLEKGVQKLPEQGEGQHAKEAL